MKRLFPLLVLVVLFGMIAGAPTTQIQTTSTGTDGSLFPIARNDTVLIAVNTDVDIDVLANDEETNAGTEIFLTSTLVREPLHGTATVETDFIHYDPDTNFSGVDSLIYEISNDFGADEEATVLIFINDRPVANPDMYTVLPNTSSQLDVLANDTDADGDDLFIQSITQPPHGGAFPDDENTVITYLPDNGFVGKDSLRYIVNDNNAGRDTAWVNILVNTKPVAVVDTVTTLPMTAVSIDVLANDTDGDGDALTVVEIVDAPNRGTAQITNSGTRILYTPTGGLTGADSFLYAIEDPQGGGDTTTVVVHVNTPPTARDDEATTVLATPVNIDVLDNDDDPENDPLTITAIVAPPVSGTAQIINSGTLIRYTPDEDFDGADTFDYEVSDDEGGTDQATVVVEVFGNALVQFIHNAFPTEPVDIYIDDTRLLDDFDFQTATPYMDLIGGEVTVDVTDGGATNNNDPFFSATLTLEPTVAYVVIATGEAEQNFSLVVKEDAHPTANPGFVEFFIAHGVLDAPASGIDVRRLDPSNNNLPYMEAPLANNLDFGEVTDYETRLGPGIYNIDAANFDGSTVYDVYQFALGGLSGQTFTLLLSGLLDPQADDPAFTLLGFDNQGDPIVPTIVTDVAEEPDLPTEFALRGNFPNPFNPTTTLQFDLPQTAEVSVEIIDVLGRSVMTLPAAQIEAGANRHLDVNASSLASGTYLYRLLARTATETMVRTGRMTLVK